MTVQQQLTDEELREYLERLYQRASTMGRYRKIGPIVFAVCALTLIVFSFIEYRQHSNALEELQSSSTQLADSVDDRYVSAVLAKHRLMIVSSHQTHLAAISIGFLLCLALCLMALFYIPAGDPQFLKLVVQLAMPSHKSG